MTIFRDFEKLYTFQSAADKSARHIQLNDLSFIEGGALIVDKGRVVWVGRSEDIPSIYKKKSKSQKMKGLIGYPGFVECHTHSVFAGDRSEEFDYRLQGHSYQEISARGGGILTTVKAVRNARPGDLTKLAQSRVDEFCRQGITTLEIKSGYGLDFESETKMLKVAGKLKGPKIHTTYLGPHALSPEYSSYATYLEEVCKDLEKIKKQKLSKRADIFIEKGFFELPWAEEYLKKARDLDFDLVIHGEQFTRSGGVDMAIKYGARSVDHVVNASKEDINALANSDVTSVLLPTADHYLKINYPPARQMLDRGVRVALATDFNPGSSPTQDIAFAGLLARMQMHMTLPEVFVAYTLGAAYALGEESEAGTLSVGKRADFFTSTSELQGFFYSVGHTPVAQVYREGKSIWRTGGTSH